jgi:hypothetical protein
VDSDQALKALCGIRLTVGLSAWLTPRLAGKSFGIDADANPVAPYLSRLFGVRDLVLAVGPLGAEGDARARWLQLGIACDVADAAAGAMGGRAGYLNPVSAAMVTTTALGAAVLGVLASR